MHTIKVNIAGLWNNYNFEDREDAIQFLAYVRDAVKQSASDPTAGFTAGDEDEIGVIYGRHVVGYKLVRSEES